VILTAWAAVAAAETVRKTADIPAQIKWPNDLLLSGRKIAGILIEQKSLVVVGIGLNVNQSTEQLVAAELNEAGSLASATGRLFDRNTIAKQLISELDTGYAALLAGQLSGLESRWAKHVGLIGHSVVVTALDGTCHRGRLRELTFRHLALDWHDGSTTTCLAPEEVRQLHRAKGDT
jgi:BirA family biotin operon repressor/biotin-[acetyl-CoA-carboxylase] ligase